MPRQIKFSCSTISWALLILAFASQTGCQALLFRIEGTPASSLRQECLAVPKRGLKTIDVTKLGQPEPEVYVLGPGDIIGIYIPGIIPFQDVTDAPAPPPVYYPEPGSQLPPSIGLPFVVLENGKVTLPGLQSLEVEGLTVEEATLKITEAYTERNILKDQNIIPLVTLFRPRTYNILVVREDTGGGQDEHAANGSNIQLAAYKNDVLHALIATGGMPGLRAKNEVRIYRNAAHRVAKTEANGGVVNFVDNEFLPIENNASGDGPDAVIPLRIYEGEQINIPTADIILGNGDVVYISNRTAEVFYTSGLLPGGEHQLPRDYDIDIFEAMSIAGFSYGSSQGGGGGGGFMPPNTGVPATQLFIFRECPNGSEFTIKIDLEEAIANDRERILVQSGDKLFLRMSPAEEMLTFGIFSFFAYGFQQLFRN